MLRKVLPALALALVACSSSSNTAPDAGAPDTCSSDAECSAGFKCDRPSRHCVCTGDSACPGGFCNAFTGLCVASVPGCTSDSACAKTEYCNLGLRSCKPLTAYCGACKTDAECGAGSKCAPHPSYPTAGSFCVPQCSATGSCGAGQTCLARDATPSADKLCYPAKGACGISNACTPDSRKPCAADADCGDPAQACDLTLHTCVAKVRSCQAGFACDPQQLICLAACGSDADCAQIEHSIGYQCIASACVKRATCNQDSDCTNGQICQQNPDTSKSCAPGCVNNGDCPLGQSCSKADPNHPKCTQGCATNPDCPLNQICSQGACTSSIAGSCAQTCQATQVCSIAATCDGTSCCAQANLGFQCATSTAQNPSYPCGSCTSGGSCPSAAASCPNNCYVLSLRACNTDNDCASFPGTHCTGAKLCQTMVWGKPCPNGDADCPWKGFKCRAQSQFCGSSFGGTVCLPDAQGAQQACVLGHP